jgi:hypothetical protein
MRPTSLIAPSTAAVVLVIALGPLAGCASMAPSAEKYVPPPIGATWVTARHDTGSYGSGSVQLPAKRGERTWHGKQMITFEGPELTLLAHPGGEWVAQVKGDTPVLSWDPPLSWDWPLEVGKTWTRKYRVTIHATKRTIPYEVTQVVAAYEDVVVPAGTFKAFKVTSSDTLGNENVTWFSSELGLFVKQSLRRTEKHAAGAGTRETQLVSQTIRK